MRFAFAESGQGGGKLETRRQKLEMGTRKEKRDFSLRSKCPPENGKGCKEEPIAFEW
jgi:hypothetical protein